MDFFECCHQCKAPKRHPGCHDSCPDYIKAKKLWDARNENIRKKRTTEADFDAARLNLARFRKR